MKNIKPYIFLLSLSILQSCWLNKNEEDEKPERQSVYSPVVVNRTELNAVQLQNPRPVNRRSEAFVNGNFVYVNDHRDGFHIYDNTNPAQPQKIKYLKALGASTLSFKNDLIYVNQATDLVILKIDPSGNNLQIIKRFTDIFPAIASPDYFNHAVQADEIVIDWKLKN